MGWGGLQPARTGKCQLVPPSLGQGTILHYLVTFYAPILQYFFEIMRIFRSFFGDSFENGKISLKRQDSTMPLEAIVWGSSGHFLALQVSIMVLLVAWWFKCFGRI